jgi:DNA-binding IclR family transcriptional regulator
LRLVAAAGSPGVRVSDLAQQANLHVATAHRLISALLREGFVAQDTATRSYTPGPELLAIAFQAQHSYGLESRLLPMLERLAQATGDVVYATVRAGDEAVCLALREGNFPIRALPIGPGTRRPLGIGAGSLAILSFLPTQEAAEIIQRNADRYTAFGQTAETVRCFQERAQRAGFALNDGRILPGMAAVAVPLPSSSGRPIAAISVCAIEARMLADRQEEVVQMLHAEMQRFRKDEVL